MIFLGAWCHVECRVGCILSSLAVSSFSQRWWLIFLSMCKWLICSSKIKESIWIKMFLLWQLRVITTCGTSSLTKGYEGGSLFEVGSLEDDVVYASIHMDQSLTVLNVEYPFHFPQECPFPLVPLWLVTSCSGSASICIIWRYVLLVSTTKIGINSIRTLFTRETVSSALSHFFRK